MVTEYKVTFEKLSVAKFMTIFCKIKFMPILSTCNPETLQNLPKLIPKMLNLGGKLLEYKVLGWAEFQWVYITVTQIGHKFVIGSWPPQNGKIAQNSMTYKFQITYDRKLKLSGFISVTERFISAKFQQNLRCSPWVACVTDAEPS